LFKCRKAEHLLNNCVFQSLGLKKVIPDGEQIHLKEKPLYRPNVEDRPSLKAYDVAKKEGTL
jgi:NADH dehydrogenase (ubiquinone) 1 alpha subcomplex subunit 8